MNMLVAFIILSLIIASCNTESRDDSDFTISMNLRGFEDSTKFKLLDLDKLKFIDSTYLFHGRLEFRGSIDEPVNARIHTVDNKYLVLWIEKGIITVDGTYDNFDFSKIDGSSLNAVLTKYRDKQRELDFERDSLMQIMMQLMSSQSDDAEDEFQRLNSLVNQIDKDKFSIRVQGIENEQASHYTIKELYFLRNDFTNDSLELFFNRFPESLQKTKYGEVIRTYIENKPVTIGDHYLDIEGRNEAGQMIKLSELDGNYILLDFWASWCGPCRIENPNLVKASNNFKDRGFEIFSFSIDSNIDSWKNALVKDSLTWTNVIDYNGSYSKMSALYGVRAIPSSFLINPEGIIIAKNLRGNALEDKLHEEMRRAEK